MRIMLLYRDQFSGAVCFFCLWRDLPDMIIADEGLCILANFVAVKAKDKVLFDCVGQHASRGTKLFYLANLAFTNIT